MPSFLIVGQNGFGVVPTVVAIVETQSIASHDFASSHRIENQQYLACHLETQCFASLQWDVLY